jgi:hypothetical protein
LAEYWSYFATDWNAWSVMQRAFITTVIKRWWLRAFM